MRSAAILSVMVTSGVEVPAQTAATSQLMQAKLALCQKSIEAILTSFALLEQESNALGQVTKSPHGRSCNPEYPRQSRSVSVVGSTTLSAMRRRGRTWLAAWAVYADAHLFRVIGS